MVAFKLIGASPAPVVEEPVAVVPGTVAAAGLGEAPPDSAMLVLEDDPGKGELPPERSPGSARLWCRCLSSSVWSVIS